MSFHKSIDPHMAHPVTPDVAALPAKINLFTLPDNLFGRIITALAAAWKSMGEIRPLPSVTSLNDHLRRDIGVGPARDFNSRGYY